MRGEIEWEEEPLVNNNCVVSAFMPNTGAEYAPFKACSPGHRVFCGENNFRLYDKQHSNTFIFLRRAERQSGYDLSISIALEKINQKIQEVCDSDVNYNSPARLITSSLASWKSKQKQGLCG
jgi:hypothetical protein